VIDQTLSALADPTRRSVVELLRDEPRPAGELARALGASAAAMSRHLRVLRESGLVEPGAADADARLRVYRLRPEPFDELRRWVEEVEAFWGAELAAFKEHVERRSDR
jgi:DNA-binding transcriptional ArsR family regulator